MIDPFGKIKLIDVAFSYRKQIDKGPPIGLGTRGFHPPEIIEKVSPSIATDIYGWGATMYLLATGDIPPGIDENNTSIEVTKFEIHPKRPDLPTRFCNLIESTLSFEPSKRPSNMLDIIAELNNISSHISGFDLPGTVDFKTPLQPNTVSWRDLALGIAKTICSHSEMRDSGISWKKRVDDSSKWMYPSNIYSGTAGITLFLASSTSITKDATILRTVTEAACWLSSGEWGHGSTLCGLYTGEAGIGLLYLRLAELLNVSAYQHMALMRALRLRGVKCNTIDLVDGTSGLLLFLIELQKVSTSKDILQWSIDVGDQLLKNAIKKELDNNKIGLYWEVPSALPHGPVHSYIGLLHGAAGVGLALLTLGISTKQTRFINAAIQVGEFLLSEAYIEELNTKNVYLWRRTVEDNSVDLSAHCHGSGGIAQFLVRLWCYCKDDRFLEAAHRGTMAITLRDPRHPSQCHGLAGDGELFLDMFQATRDYQYEVMAQDIGRKLIKKYQIESKDIFLRDEQGDINLDFMTGYAGIGSFMLRLSDCFGVKSLILPDISSFKLEE